MSRPWARGASGAYNAGAMQMHERQRRFRGIGPDGQAKLQAARVAIVGLGALGSVLAERLARAGVGRLVLIDRDFVEEANLGTQALYTRKDAEERQPKAVAAERRLREIHPEIAVEGVVADLTPENAEELLQDADVVLDGTDNVEARLLLNDVCVKHGVPWVYGSVVEGYGQTMAIVPRRTACLRCLYPEPPPAGALPTCETVGLLATAPAAVASLAATQALRLLAGRSAIEGLLYLDVWDATWKRLPVPRRPDCATCGRGRFEFLEGGSRSSRATVLCGRDAVQLRVADPSATGLLDLGALAGRLRPAGVVRANEHLVSFRPHGQSVELVVFRDGRAIVKGVRSEAEARGLYARYVGL